MVKTPREKFEREKSPDSTLRISDKAKFLGESKFYCSSFIPVRERVKTAEARNRMLDTEVILKPIQFRERNKDKELHGPMQFRYFNEDARLRRSIESGTGHIGDTLRESIKQPVNRSIDSAIGKRDHQKNHPNTLLNLYTGNTVANNLKKEELE